MEGFYCDLFGPCARDHDDGHIGPLLVDEADHLQAFEAEDVEVGEHHVEITTFEVLEERCSILGFDDHELAWFSAEGISNEFAIEGFVLHTEDDDWLVPFSHLQSPLRGWGACHLGRLVSIHLLEH